MSLDDVYHVDRVLAHGAGGLTELVSIDGAGPFVRKKLPVEIANQGVWSAIGAIDCARLPKVEATYSLPDQFVVVYDYVPGQTLEELVTARGRLGAAEAASLVGDICEAAAALHSVGIIHRDLSPRNVIVAADGAHLIDLGIARMRVEGAKRDTTSLGTRGFASPEQYGFAQTDARSDVYAIGKLLGFMLTGMQPDWDAYEAELANTDAVDGRLAVVVRRACAFEPSARYQSAAELADAVAAASGEAPGPRSGEKIAAHGASAAPVSVAAGEKKTRSLRAKVLFAVGVAVLLAVVALVVRFALAGGQAGEVLSEKQAGEASSVSVTAETTAAGVGAADGAPVSTTTDNVISSSEVGEVEIPLEIVESGWSAGAGGYVHYAFGVRNTSENAAVELAGVKVSGYDKDGKLLFTEDSGIMIALPGRTSYFSGQAGDGGAAPDRVEFTLQTSSATKARRMDDALELEVTDLSARKTATGTTFVGTYSVTGSDAALASIPSYINSTAITLVLRDASGNIIYGTNTYAYNLSLGESQTFQIDATGLPAYATAEAYAVPW